jgi:hypothetical protein
MNEQLNVTRLPPPKKFLSTPSARKDILAGARAALASDAPPPPVGREPEQYRQLGLEEIQIYEHNPRVARNTQFDEIKDALRIAGLGKVLLHVTRRPGESVYTLSYGGATRFKAIQELWAENNDDRFRSVRCLIQPFSSDLALRADHIIENTQRTDMTFWDTAVAFIKLHRSLSDESGADLSGRDFESRCAELGISSLNRRGFGLYQYAVNEFGQFRFSAELGLNDLKRIQPQFAAYDRLAALKGDVNIVPGMQGVMGRLDAAWEGRGFELNKLLQGTDLAVSTALGLAMMEMPKAIEYSKDKYTNTWEKMLARLRNTTLPAPKPSSVMVPDVLPSIEEVHARIAGAPPMPAVTLPNVRNLPPAYPLIAPAEAVAPAGVDLVEQVFKLAMKVCEANALEKHIHRCDSGYGWYMEPITSPEIHQEKPDIPNRRRLDLWSILAQLNGQWHEDVYLTLPEKSLWRRVLSKQPGVTNDERQAVIAVPPAHTAYAHFVMGAAPWGTRMYYCETLNQVEHYSSHDAFVALMFCQFQLMREQPERFAHIRMYARGEPRLVKTGDWE